MYGSELITALQYVDRTVDMTFTRIATGLTDLGRQQAALGIHIGGLVLRHIKDIAVPVELAANSTALPKVHEICQALSTAGLTEPGLLSTHLRTRITTLQHQLTTQLDQC